MVKKKYIIHDIVRVIATILVIVGHSNYINFQTKYGGTNLNFQNFSPFYKVLNGIVGIIYTFHMPLFFFLSGALLFLSLEHEENFRDFFIKKFKRLIYPFVLVTIFYVFPLKYLSNYYLKSNSILRDFIYGQFLLLGSNHLWFLVALFQIIIYIYIIEKLLKLNLKLKIVLVVVLYAISEYLKYDGFVVLRAIKDIIWVYLGYFYQQNYYKINKIINKSGAKLLILSILAYIICFILPKYSIIKTPNLLLAFLGIEITYIFIELYLVKIKIFENRYLKIILKYSFIVYFILIQ